MREAVWFFGAVILLLVLLHLLGAVDLHSL
jgi:hypothetical protein